MKNAIVIASRVRSIFALVLLSLAAVTCAFPTCAGADDTKPVATKKTPWTPEDVVNQEDASQFEISPDAKFAVWVKGGADKEKDERVSNLFISNLSDGKEIQLTRGPFQVSQPQWSPSGETIAFLSGQPLLKPKPDLAPLQLWLISPSGGAPWSVTEFERGIEQIQQ